MAERTKAGLAAAKAKGRVGGRKRKMTASKIESAKKLLSSGVLPKDVARNLGISIPTLYVGFLPHQWHNLLRILSHNQLSTEV